MLKNKLRNIYLQNNFEFEEANSEVNFILKEVFSRTLVTDEKLNETEEKIAIKIVEERVKTRKPLQQILGFAFFCDEKFEVNENTLIPRPETELLVFEILKENLKNKKILDIGSGSGCIGIILSKNSNAEIFSCDICEKALKIAKKNAEKLNAKVEFIKSNLFENINEKFDIIVSNPPYIPQKDKSSLQIEVRDFEPEKALYTKDEYGLEFYEKIITQCSSFLRANGKIFFEVGQNQAQSVKKIFLQNKFKNIKIIKDLNGIERIISANI